MVIHMKTTLSIDDSVMRRLRIEAERRGTTASALAEAGLRRILADLDRGAEEGPLPPLPTWRGGEPLVDIAGREGLCRAMDEDWGRSTRTSRH